MTDDDISDISFFTENGKEFRFFFVGDDADGFRLIPYLVDGKPNKDWECNETFSREEVYVLTAERPIDGPISLYFGTITFIRLTRSVYHRITKNPFCIFWIRAHSRKSMS